MAAKNGACAGNGNGPKVAVYLYFEVTRKGKETKNHARVIFHAYAETLPMGQPF